MTSFEKYYSSPHMHVRFMMSRFVIFYSLVLSSSCGVFTAMFYYRFEKDGEKTLACLFEKTQGTKESLVKVPHKPITIFEPKMNGCSTTDV